MPSKATITAKQGPANSITTKVVMDIYEILFDLRNQILKVKSSSDQPGTWQEFDISANNTSTLTYANPNYTLTIS
jgi:hypothetical protein